MTSSFTSAYFTVGQKLDFGEDYGVFDLFVQIGQKLFIVVIHMTQQRVTDMRKSFKSVITIGLRCFNVNVSYCNMH